MVVSGGDGGRKCKDRAGCTGSANICKDSGTRKGQRLRMQIA